jgi:hypothetical protein
MRLSVLLVAQRQSKNTLTHQRLNLVLDITRVASVDEAGCKPTGQVEAAINLSQKQRPGIAPPSKQATTALQLHISFAEYWKRFEKAWGG